MTVRVACEGVTANTICLSATTSGKFDVMSTERDHYGLRIAHVNALHDRQLANVLLWSLGKGITAWLAIPSQLLNNTESNKPTGNTKTPGKS